MLFRVHKIEVIVAKAEIDGQVSNGRKMVLHVEAGLPAFTPALERRKNIRIAAAVKEKTFAFAQTDEVDPRFEKMSAPRMGEIAFDSDGKRGA